MIKSCKESKEEFVSIIGRLNHVAFVILLSRHFLLTLREKLKWIANVWWKYELNKEELEIWCYG